MPEPSTPPVAQGAGWRWVAALVGLRVAAPLLLLHPAWEFHRDEFLYFAMGDHLDPWRMQFPPLIATVARLGRWLFGDAVWAARVPAAVAGGAILLVLFWLVRRLGGGRWAMILVTLGSLAAPVYLRPSVLMHPVVFDQLWATLAFAALILAAVRHEPRWWLLVGVALGLGALTKFSVAFIGCAIGVTAVAMPVVRGQLATRWPWIGAAIALGLSLPSLAGQFAHGWPFLQQMTALRATQLDDVSRIDFVIEQPLMLGGAVVLVAAGILAAWQRDAAAQVALLCAGTLVLLLLALQGKAYYAAPGFPVVIATGAVWLERACWPTVAASRGARVARWVVPGFVGMAGLGLLPLGVPCLAPDAMARYTAAIGITRAARTNDGDVLPLPQDYADMLGWRAMVQAASAVIDALPPEERAAVLLGGSNYGEAGALAMYRARYDLPYPVSVHGDFHAWGTYGRSGAVTVLVDRPDARRGLEQMFDEVQEVRRHAEPRAVPEERDVRIYLARGPRQSIETVWRELGPRWD